MSAKPDLQPHGRRSQVAGRSGHSQRSQPPLALALALAPDAGLRGSRIVRIIAAMRLCEWRERPAVYLHSFRRCCRSSLRLC